MRVCESRLTCITKKRGGLVRGGYQGYTESLDSIGYFELNCRCVPILNIITTSPSISGITLLTLIFFVLKNPGKWKHSCGYTFGRWQFDYEFNI